MNNSELLDILRKEIIKKEPNGLKNDEEFFFSVGQVAFFMINCDKQHKTHQDTIKFLQTDNVEKLKEKLLFVFKKYGRDINAFNTKFNNLFTMVIAYDPSTNKIDEETLLRGIMSPSLLFETTAETKHKVKGE